MTRRLAVVIAVDGLRASALGAYGNTAQASPALDELASQSVVVEWMLCTSPELSTFYGAAWGAPPLSREIAERGGAATLITDDHEVAAWGDGAGFSNVLLLEAPSGDAAESISDTSLAKLFAVASELMGENASEAPASLFWIHARGLNGPWDAPQELRAAQLDEGDPAPPAFTTPPDHERPVDHDALLGFQVAYAAQVAALDECVGGLLAALADIGVANNALIALIGTSGFALGEHGVVGSSDRRLFSARLHVPCLLRAPGAAPAPPRWTPLATPIDLYSTLARWLGVNVESQLETSVDLLAAEHTVREHVIAHGRDGEQAIRTRSWMLRSIPAPGLPDSGAQRPLHSTETVDLYVKPDDRWEANEVGALCPDEVEQLTAILRAVSRHAQ